MDARSLSSPPDSLPKLEQGAAPNGWRGERGTPSLADMFATVRTAKQGSFWRKLLAFLGPGYLVAVGYMDPGNWATSLAGGSKFGYALLTVALLSNVMAIVLQSLCTRLGVGAGRDLAQACRDSFPRWVSMPLWLSAEIAITATDLAEVIGTAIGLNLLFHIPLQDRRDHHRGRRVPDPGAAGLRLPLDRSFCRGDAGRDRGVLCGADRDGRSRLGRGAPGLCPDAGHFRQSRDAVSGARHSRRHRDAAQSVPAFGAGADPRLWRQIEEKREAITLATIDSSIALCLALTINASILILAAATFNRVGKTDVAELDQAHAFLAPLLGSTLAPTLFAVALLCCGLNSTITATLSGQIVMEGFLNLRIAPWLRRMVTRMIAIVPAVVVTVWAGEKATGQLLILSQVVLSLQLPFAVVPLVMFTASRAKMGPFVAPRWLTALAALTAAVIIALNAKLVWDYVMG